MGLFQDGTIIEVDANKLWKRQKEKNCLTMQDVLDCHTIHRFPVKMDDRAVHTYTVYESCGSCPMNDGGFSRSFQTYREAIQFSLERIELLAVDHPNWSGFHADVIVYENGEDGESIVLFSWKNW